MTKVMRTWQARVKKHFSQQKIVQLLASAQNMPTHLHAPQGFMVEGASVIMVDGGVGFAVAVVVRPQ